MIFITFSVLINIFLEFNENYKTLYTVKNTVLSEKYNEKNVKQFNEKYSLWNKRSILRLIEIMNSLQKNVT